MVNFNKVKLIMLIKYKTQILITIILMLLRYILCLFLKALTFLFLVALVPSLLTACSFLSVKYTITYANQLKTSVLILLVAMPSLNI